MTKNAKINSSSREVEVEKIKKSFFPYIFFTFRGVFLFFFPRSSLTELWIGDYLHALYAKPFWKSLRNSVVLVGRLR